MTAWMDGRCQQHGWLLLMLVICVLPAGAQGVPEADLILEGTVWTGMSEAPRAEAVAVRGTRILAVGTVDDVRRHQGPDTRVIAVAEGFIVPGFIDSHTHFDRAGALLLGVNLLDVADEAGLIQRVREARDRMPDGTWIVGGDWGAYEQWERGSKGQPDRARARPVFRPHRSMIDSITANHPVLLSKWDDSMFLANTLALDAVGAECSWEGVDCDAAGERSGRLTQEAAQRIAAVIPPKSMEQRLAEARVALRRLRSMGVTTIHDITDAEQMTVFQTLRQQGELTVRVYARPTLNQWKHLAELGIRHGFGDEWIRTGGMKGFVDGIMGNSSARFYEPYLTSGELGRWRDMMYPSGNMQRLLIKADSAGLWPQVHAIGDHAIDTLLAMYARTREVNGPKERRFRVIHTQVLRGPEVADRMADLGVIAEMQPYHAIDDMRWMEQRIGDRSRWAYAFNTIHDAGVRLSFGSDWPGTNASWYPADPLLGIYAAVTRKTLEGAPEGGWYPEERIDVETALRAYTVNNAYAAGEEDLKGTLKPGMLADITVLSRDITSIPREEVRNVEVLYTMVDGEIVYQNRTALDQK